MHGTFCRHCGSSCARNDRFCRSCGASLDAAEGTPNGPHTALSRKRLLVGVTLIALAVALSGGGVVAYSGITDERDRQRLERAERAAARAERARLTLSRRAGIPHLCSQLDFRDYAAVFSSA
jgi:hypothetical protein